MSAAIDPSGAPPPIPLNQSFIPLEPQAIISVQVAQEQTVPPVPREKPATPTTPAPPAPSASPPQPDATAPRPFGEASPPPPGYDGVLGKIRDWLSSANREFQNVIIRGLSTKPGGNDDEIAKKLEETKQDDARRREAEAKAAEDKRKADALKSADTKKADEAKKAADAKKAEEKKAVEAEAKRRLAEQQAREQRLADEAKRKREAEAAGVTPSPPVALPDTTALDEARQREERTRIEQADKEAKERIAALKREQEEKASRDRDREAQAQPRRVELRPEPIERPDDRPRPTPRRLVEGGAPYDGLALYEARRRIPRYGADDYSVEPVVRPRGHVRGYVRGYRAYARRSIDRCYAAGKRSRHGRRYVVAHGDSLWKISRKHYRSGRTYHRIYSANRRIIRDPDLIYPCQRFVVPKKHKRRRH